MRYDHAMAEARDRVQPTDAAIGRVRHRLAMRLDPATAELSVMRGPSTDQVARVRRRIAASTAPRHPRISPRWIAGGTLVGVATAAMVAVAVIPGEHGSPVVDRALVASEDPIGLGSHVVATVAGSGAAIGTEEAIDITWDAGRIEIEVDPDAGVRLVVGTPEATVTVTGTRFVVDRDARGTAVEVIRGSVDVACGPGTAVALTAEDTHTCLPTTAAGLLARGQLLTREGRNTDALAAFDLGLARVTSGSETEVELLAASVGPLVAADQRTEALDRVNQALGSDPRSRGQELHQVAARLYLAAGDCVGALPHLDALDSLTPAEAAHRGRCAAP